MKSTLLAIALWSISGSATKCLPVHGHETYFGSFQFAGRAQQSDDLATTLQLASPKESQEKSTETTPQSAQTDTNEIVLQRGDARRSGTFNFPAIRSAPKVKWRVNLGELYLGTPLVVDGVLYSGGADGSIRALDAATGDLRWSTGGFEVIESALAISGDVVIGGGQNKTVKGLDRKTGRLLWSFAASAPVFTPPLIVGNQVYIATFDKFHALNLKSGKQNWEIDLGDEPAIVGSPAFANETVYVTAGPVLLALDSTNGKERWRVDSQVSFYGLALDDQFVFAGNADGHLYAFDQKSGEDRWKFKSGFGKRDDIWSAPAVSADRVYIGSRDKSVYALDARTGRKVWSFKTAGDAVGDPVIGDGVVYLSDSNHALPPGRRRLHALDAATGKEIWKFEINSTLLTTPALGEGAIFVTITGAVLALE